MEPLKINLPTISDMERGFDIPDAKEQEQLKADGFNAEEWEVTSDGYNCPVCKNKLFILTVAEVNGHYIQRARDCACVKTRNTIRRMMRSGLRNIISDYTFDKYEVTEEWQKTIKDSAMAYAKEPLGWFFIGGQSGSGKTHICTAICRQFILAGKEVRYMLWRDDVLKIKASVTDSTEHAAAMDQFKRAEILYIDDLFKTGKSFDGNTQRPTGADINVAFELLNYRYNAKLPTIISSESTVSDLLEIDEAVAGRIVELARAFSLKPDRSRNYRLRNAVEV